MSNKIKQLEDKLLAAKVAYYIDNNPIMTDDDYDLLEDELRILDPHNRILSMTGADIKDKQNWPVAKLSEVSGSLEKVKSYPEIEAWMTEQFKKFPGTYYYNPKGDGGSIEATYVDGKLVQAVTRGNGYEGENITKNFLLMKNTAKTIKEKETVVLKGELLVLHKDFIELNKRKAYVNPRNAATGIAKNINGENCDLVTPLYYAMSIDGKNITMSNLQKEINRIGGLRHIGIHYLGSTLKEILGRLKEAYERITKDRGTFGFDIDGLVIKGDEDPIMKSNKPINYIALKFPAQSAVGVVGSIRFERSRTGRIVPVAILQKSVFVAGGNLTNFSLGSWDLMNTKKIYPGSVVEVVRSNDVIPYINKSLDNSKAKVLKIDDVKKLMGDNTLYQKGAHLFSDMKDENSLVLDIMNIVRILEYKNISDSTVTSIVKHFKLKEAYQFFDINPDKLLTVDGFGQGKVDIIKQQFKDKNRVDIKSFIRCLGVDNLGSSRIVEICNTYGIDSLDDLYKLNAKDLEKVAGISNTLANIYIDGLNDKRTFANELAKRLTIEKQSKVVKSNVLNGLSFCITGNTSMKRKEFEKLIVENGGKNVSVGKANYLITNDSDSGSGKNKIAQQKGIPVITEKDFFNKFNLK